MKKFWATFVAQVLKKFKLNSVAELRIFQELTTKKLFRLGLCTLADAVNSQNVSKCYKRQI